MRINRKLGWLGILTIVVILAAGIFSGSALAQAGTSLSVNPTPAEARTCSTSTVAVRVADVTDLTAFHLELSFDPSKIEVTAVAPGSFLIGTGETYLPEPTNAVNNTTGTVVWGLAKQGSGGNPNPVSGSGDILVLTIKAKLPNETSALTIDGAKSMLVDWPEAHSIPFTDTDGVINTRSCAPTDIALSNASIAENQPVNTVIGTLSATDPDAGDTSFTYAFADLVGHPDAQYFNISGSSLRANIPFDYETKSSYSIRIKVTDPWGESYEENFIISVTDINDAPVLAHIGNKTVDELTTLSFTAAATDQDLPAQTLTFSLVGAPSGAAIDPATGVFTWTPTEAQGPGEYTFDVCVSDGALSDCETITVTVNEVNVAPVLSPIGNFDIEELVPFTFTASATDADIPAQTLTYSLEDGTAGLVPAGASINPGTGVFTWTPTEAQGPGVYTFDVCVSDGALQDCETITITVYEDLQVTDLDLHNAITPTGPWAAVPGSYASGFVMQLDPAVEYYYLDTNNITSNRPLADGLYPFFISSHPADFFDYWAARGVVSGATGWQGQMWQIINGNAPFFYLKVEGTNYTLLDGLQYAMGNTSAVLRVNGSYLLGDYRFSGVVKDAFGFSETVDVDIRFIGLLELTDAQLQYSLDQITWTDLSGSFGAGYSMLLDTAQEFYYLNAPSVTVNRPLAEGLHPFFVKSYPADFFAYWAGKGVVSGATGWQGVMWNIINGNAPIFYLKVSAGPVYQLVDGLNYQYAGAVTYLRINGSYLPGEYSYSGTVTDIYGYTDDAEVDILFNDIPVAQAQSVSTAEDTAVSINLGAVDLYPGTLTWEIVSSPAHGILSGTAPNMTYTPDADYHGTDSFTFRVNDGTSNSNTATVSITITAVNDAPVLDPIGNKSVDEGVELSFMATAADVDGDTLTFSLVGAPSGAAIDPATGVFTWTPTEAQGPGEYTFTVKVCDNGTPVLCDEEEIKVTVNEVNVAPVLGAIGDKTVDELTLLSFTATATDADIPANTLTFSLVGAPSGAAIDPATGAFTWTPTEAQGPGEYTFTVKVCDNGTPVLCDEEEIKVTVSEVNVAPVLDPIGDKTVDELTLLSFTATATDADIPANTLTFSLVNAPAGAAIDPATGVFTWTPTEAQGPGEYTFTVKVCDNGTPGLCDEEEIKVTVNEVNVAPVAVDDAYSTLKNQVLNVGAPGVLGNDSDADIPANTLTAVLVTDIPSGEGTLVLAASGAFSYTPPVGFTGQTSFYYKVFDGGLYSGTAKVTITVTDSNLAPTDILLTDQTILENLPVGSVVAYLSALDPNAGDTFTFSLVSGTGDTDNASFSISGNKLLSAVVFDYETKDSYSIRIRVTDQGGLWYEKSFIISILDVNDAPIANDQTVSTPEDTPLAITLTGSDQDGDPLTYAVIAHPTHGVLTGTAPNLTYTPAADYHGTDSFTFQASDYALVSNIATITINVTPVNDAPVLGAIGNKSVPELTLLTFTAAATDVDGDTLTFSLVGAPAGAAIDPATGVFTWTPTEAQGPGEYTFDVCVSDGVLSDCETITVTVNEVNVAPLLGAIGDKTVDELTLLSFTATATDTDIPANTLTFSLVSAPSGAAIDPATGAFTWTPTEAQGPGEYTFTVKVCDNGTPVLCDEEEIKVTVNEVNVAPLLGAIGDKTVDELTLLSFTATATDTDIPANTLTFSLVSAPAGAAIDPATGVFTWTPTEAQGPGEYTFTVKVCDNGTPVLCDQEEIKVTVFEVNTAPTARDQSVTTPEDTPIDILLDVSDPENDPLTTIIITGPSHGQVSVNGIVVTYTPDLNYYGADSFTYKVNDGLEDSNIATVSITVTPVNDPPVAYGMTVETPENFPVNFELLATDPEGDIGTFIIVTTPAHGTLDCDGRYCTYTPDPNWNGEDGFYFKVNDGELDSNEAFVKIIVHQGPRIYIPILFK